MKMKAVYITTEDILGPAKTGEQQFCKRNFLLIQQALGAENARAIVLSKNPELLSCKFPNVTVFFTKRGNLSILRYSLQKRLQFSEKLETQVLANIMSQECDIVFIKSTLLGNLQARLPKEIKQVVLMNAIIKDYIREQAALRPYILLLKRSFIHNESLSIHNADLLIVLNKRDATQLKKYYDYDADLILPLTIEDTFSETCEAKAVVTSNKLQLLFVGSLYSSNVHGITWFIQKVMPHVNAELAVVGKGFEKLKSKLSRDNVNIVGTVETLSGYYHKAHAVVSPILVGNGMKVKTAEALMYGKPMFATDEALEGYEIDDLDYIFRCNSPQQFITTINRYSEREEYEPFCIKIREKFLEKYDSSIYSFALRDILDKIKGA